MYKVPATLFVVCIVYYAFRCDRRLSATLSLALWIPSIWLMIMLSRPVSQWLPGRTYVESGETSSEMVEAGSPIDRAIHSMILVAAVWVLIARRPQWSDVFRRNRWFVVLLLFAAVSILWSGYPMVSFKRCVRALETSSAVLIVVTELDYFGAIDAIFRRVAFLHIPTSVLFIKYYDQYGMSWDVYGGMQLTGVTTSKNILGRLCMIVIVYLAFVLLDPRRHREGESKIYRWMLIGYLGMSVWLIAKSNCMTGTVSAVIGVAILLFSRYIGLSRFRARMLVCCGMPLTVILINVFQALPSVTGMLGRDPSLTGRSLLWGDLIGMRDNVLFGAGYGGFWIGTRLDRLWQKYWWQPESAHNGYLEMFLELGLIGLFILMACLVSFYRKVQTSLDIDLWRGGLFLAVFVMFLIYNVTESATEMAATMWFVFSLFGMSLCATTHDVSGFGRCLKGGGSMSGS